VVGEYPPDEPESAVRDAALSYSSTEVEVGIVSVQGRRPYYIGNAPDLLGIARPAVPRRFP